MRIYITCFSRSTPNLSLSEQNDLLCRPKYYTDERSAALCWYTHLQKWRDIREDLLNVLLTVHHSISV
jgi:hypothetical protein